MKEFGRGDWKILISRTVLFLKIFPETGDIIGRFDVPRARSPPFFKRLFSFGFLGSAQTVQTGRAFLLPEKNILHRLLRK